jgi:hypothetical protein
MQRSTLLAINARAEVRAGETPAPAGETPALPRHRSPNRVLESRDDHQPRHPSKLGKRREASRFAAFPICASGAQIVRRCVVEIKSEFFHQLAELRPWNDDLLRFPVLVHDNLLLNRSHAPKVSHAPSCGNETVPARDRRLFWKRSRAKIPFVTACPKCYTAQVEAANGRVPKHPRRDFQPVQNDRRQRRPNAFRDSPPDSRERRRP